MNRGMSWLVNSARTTVAEFLGHMLGLIVLLSALGAWTYFGSIYAALPVMLVGVLLIALVYRVVDSGRRKKGSD